MAGIDILGIHHVTALCGDPQRNVDFYTGPLGLRLVKLSVNPDDPTSYHLFYGDAVGTPGTLITFFNKRGAPQGARGVGMFVGVAFAIPDGSLGYWQNRLEKHGSEAHKNCHGETCLSFEDPDGLRLQLVERQRYNRNAWSGSGVSKDAAITGVEGVTLGTRTPASKQFLPQSLGLASRLESPMQSGNMLSRFDAGESFVDVMPTEHRSLAGRGTVHHASFRVSDSAALKRWWKEFTDRRTPVTEERDRVYYKAIYLREPGGALMSLATDKPGVMLDEDSTELGTHLCIPEALMGRRNEFERLLAPLKLPVSAT